MLPACLLQERVLVFLDSFSCKIQVANQSNLCYHEMEI